MATKTDLINSINTQITAIITQAKHRLSILPLVNELFPTPTSYAATTATGITYYVLFKKSGNTVNVVGSLSNTLSSIQPSQAIFDLPTSELYPLNENFPIIGFDSINPSENYQILISSTGIFANKLAITNAIPAYGIVFFNGNYTTND